MCECQGNPLARVILALGLPYLLVNRALGRDLKEKDSACFWRKNSNNMSCKHCKFCYYSFSLTIVAFFKNKLIKKSRSFNTRVAVIYLLSQTTSRQLVNLKCDHFQSISERSV